MKQWGIRCLFIAAVCGVLGAGAGEREISQDDVSLDLSSGELTFNDVPIDLDQLRARARPAYSISFEAGYYSNDEGGASEGIDDLFAPKAPEKPEKAHYIPISYLSGALESLAAAEVDPVRTRLVAHMPRNANTVVSDELVISDDGEVRLNGEPVELAQLSNRLNGKRISIAPADRDKLVNYRHLLSVTRALGDGIEIAELLFMNISQVRISAQIYTIGKDGSKDILTSPWVTTKPGNTAWIRVVENGAGKFRSLEHDYHQEDLSNLGVQFVVKPRVIGDDITMDGVVIIIRSTGKEEVFRDGDIPVYSYSTKKTVAPFSAVLSSSEDRVEFEIADIDGKPAKCWVSAEVVGANGLTRAERAKKAASN